MNEDVFEVVERIALARLDAFPYVLLLSGLLISLTSGLAFMQLLELKWRFESKMSHHKYCFIKLG